MPSRREGRHFLAVPAPDSQDSVLAAGHDSFSIRSGRGAIEIIVCSGIASDIFSVVANEAELSVAARSQHLAGDPNEAKGSHFLAKAFHILQPFAGREIPELDQRVGPGAGQRAAILFPADP